MNPRWAAALGLIERVEAARRGGGTRAERDEALGARRLARWRDWPAFRADEDFDAYLAARGLTREELVAALAETEESLAARLPGEPSWLTSLREGLAGPAPQATGFVRLVSPLILRACDDLRARTRKLAAGAPFDAEGVVDMLARPLVGRLDRLVQRVMVLEANAARLKGAPGEASPEERLRLFLDGLDAPGAREEMLLRYPALARRCVESLERWRDASEEFLVRLRDDAARLESFLGRPLGRLAAASGAGDSHGGGRSVLVLRFDGGARVVYKPRSMAADAAFRELVEGLNAAGLDPALRAGRVLERDGYGWAEFMAHAPCEDAAQVSRFYRRQGAWIAVLHALGCTDMHSENLIASGEHPVIVDLETLFHPRLAPLPADPARAAYIDSVMLVGLLPYPARIDGVLVDGSGLGGVSNQALPMLVDELEGLGGDEVKVVKKTGRLGEVLCRPTLRGEPVDLLDHAAAIEDGFAAAYRVLAAERPRLLAEDGPLPRFRDAAVRVVIRPTAYYSSLLIEGRHPRLLGNALEREMFFASRTWAAAKVRPLLARAADSELRQLHGGDVPLFTARPGSRALRGADGTDIPDATERAGMDVARERIGRMGEEDLARQAWIVRACLSSLAPRRAAGRLAAAPLAGADALAAADEIGARLRRTALRSGGRASWLSLGRANEPAFKDEGLHRVEPVNASLYDGTAGIALFLAQLGALTGDVGTRALAEEALAAARERREDGPTGFGAYDGLAGRVYVLSRLAALWGREDLLDEAEGLLPSIAAASAGDRWRDVIAGGAGAIPALLSLRAARPGGRALETALACARRIAGARPAHFKLPRGFAHGLSGLSWAFGELSAAAGDRSLSGEALRLAEEERALLASAWADHEDNPGASTWCHGSVGIALARLALHARRPDPAVLADARRALEHAAAAEVPANQCLCHGALGNLEAMRAGAAAFPDEPRWAAETRRREESALAALRAEGPRAALGADLVEPGLMTGLAGIGMGLLRSAAPGRVPSVLTLEPALP